MSELILSKEVYDAQYEINFKHKDIISFENQKDYLTDGEMVIDVRKNYISKNYYYVKELEEYKFNAVIAPYVTEDYLKKVLQIKNHVSLSKITYDDNGLLRSPDKDHLIGGYYATILRDFELFWYEDKIFFFVFNEAEPGSGINFDSYMFVGFVMGCIENTQNSKARLEILKELQSKLNDIE